MKLKTYHALHEGILNEDKNVYEKYKDVFSEDDNQLLQSRKVKMKYLGWIAREKAANPKEMVENIEEYTQGFNRFEKSMSKPDIYKYTYKELVNEIDKKYFEIEEKEANKPVNGVDYEIILNDKDCKIVKIENFKSAKYFNGTKFVNGQESRSWCIGRNKSNYKHYIKDTFYFIFYKGEIKEEYKQIAAQTKSGDITYWDRNDTPHKIDALPQLKPYVKYLTFIPFTLEKLIKNSEYKLLPNGKYWIKGNLFLKGKDIKSFKELNIEKCDKILDLSDNKIEDWEGCPDSIKKLIISKNKLTSLKGICEVKELVAENNDIQSLEGLKEGVQEVHLDENRINSFKGCPKSVKVLSLIGNKISSYKGIPEHLEELYIHGNPVEDKEKPEGIKTEIYDED